MSTDKVTTPANTLPSGDPVTVWSGSNRPEGTEGEFVDGGAGDDSIIASGGDAPVQGGLGDDQMYSMGGNDVLEGGDGKDNIQGDGILKAGFMNTVAGQYHASSGNAMNDSDWRIEA